MNCRRERFTVPVSVASYEKMRDAAYRQALKDGAQQGVAIALLALEKGYGWRKTRLHRMLDFVQEWMEMPEIFGTAVTGDDVIRYLNDQYHLDVERLKIDVEPGERRIE